MRVPIEQTTEANRLGQSGPSERALKNRKLSDASSALAEYQFRKMISEVAIPVRHRDAAFELFSSLANSMKGQPNMRAGLENHYGVGGVKWIAQCPDSDLSLAAGFVDIGRELLADVAAQIPQSHSENELIDGISPYSAPGVRIQFALNRAQATERAEPAHETDRAHAVFAPYVDAILLDRQTVPLLNQEMRRTPHLLPLHDLRNVFQSTAVQNLIPRMVDFRRTAI